MFADRSLERRSSESPAPVFLPEPEPWGTLKIIKVPGPSEIEPNGRLPDEELRYLTGITVEVIGLREDKGEDGKITTWASVRLQALADTLQSWSPFPSNKKQLGYFIGGIVSERQYSNPISEKAHGAEIDIQIRPGLLLTPYDFPEAADKPDAVTN